MARLVAGAVPRKLIVVGIAWAAVASAGALFVAPSAYSEVSGGPLPELVLSDATGYADFVSAELLNRALGETPETGDLASISFGPFSSETIRRIHSKAAQESAEGRPVSCVPPPTMDLGRFGSSLPMPLEDWVVTVDISFVGRVQSVTSGWSPLFAGPAYLARVEVLDLFYVAGSRLRGLTELLVLVPGSEMTVRGIHLEACPGSWPPIAEGGEYVFDFDHVGDYIPEHRPAADVLPIRDGVIENPGASHVTVAEGTTVAKLSAHARKVRERRWHLTDGPR